MVRDMETSLQYYCEGFGFKLTMDFAIPYAA
ncbi:VOC family protein [Mucilaginibacter angelicae]|uniref:VOC family protein n=1 Tax=Mucilaginibacter angelicae TaxID=869718 RepID=A0ABV6L6Q5_9SPHI